MSIFIIGDLHLGFGNDKPMDIFGSHWVEHYRKIEMDWVERVSNDDLVILAGDTSWANSFSEATQDLTWIDRLPGKKLLLKGNHDYWWETLKKMSGQYDSIHFLHNNSHVHGDYVVVGTRGWEADGGKVYRRECIRLQLSIDSVPKDKKKICVLHYPPFDEDGNPTEMTKVILDNGIDLVFFGHIHSNHQRVRQGIVDGVEYKLISCDYLDFKLHQII